MDYYLDTSKQKNAKVSPRHTQWSQKRFCVSQKQIFKIQLTWIEASAMFITPRKLAYWLCGARRSRDLQIQFNLAWIVDCKLHMITHYIRSCWKPCWVQMLKTLQRTSWSDKSRDQEFCLSTAYDESTDCGSNTTIAPKPMRKYGVCVSLQCICEPKLIICADLCRIRHAIESQWWPWAGTWACKARESQAWTIHDQFDTMEPCLLSRHQLWGTWPPENWGLLRYSANVQHSLHY